MLVLTRRIDESLVINENIIITILSIDGDRVKIGVSAPQDITIYRQELWLAIKDQENIIQQLAEKPLPDGFNALREFLVTEISGNGHTKPEE